MHSASQGALASRTSAGGVMAEQPKAKGGEQYHSTGVSNTLDKNLAKRAHQNGHRHQRRSKSGSLAIFAAIRRACLSSADRLRCGGLARFQNEHTRARGEFVVSHDEAGVLFLRQSGAAGSGGRSMTTKSDNGTEPKYYSWSTCCGSARLGMRWRGCCDARSITTSRRVAHQSLTFFWFRMAQILRFAHPS